MTEPKQVDEKEVELKEFSTEPVMIEPDVSLHIMSSITNFNSLLTGNAKDFSINIPKAKEKATGTTGYKNTKKIAMFLQQPTIEVLMVIVTIFSLFTKDTATVVADTDEVDTSVSVAYVIMFILFSGEFLLLCYTKAKYFLYDWMFYLDALAIISLIGDIQFFGSDLSQLPAALTSARTIRTVRIIRLLRLLRLARLSKLVKLIELFSPKPPVEVNPLAASDIDDNQYQATSLSTRMLDISLVKVILAIIAVLIAITFIQPATYTAPFVADLKGIYYNYELDTSGGTSYGYTTNSINEYLTAYDCAYFAYVDAINNPGITTDTSQLDLNKLSTFPSGDNEFQVVKNDIVGIEKKRISDRLILYESSGNNVKILVILDIREDNKEYALYSVYQTVFLVGLITLAIFSFKSQSESITRNVAIPLAAISKEMILLSKSGYQRSKTTTTSSGNEEEHHGRFKLYEISKIQESFEDLKSGLEAFSRYVPREVVSKVLTTNQFSQLGVHPKNVTIFFSDIAGYTSICEKLKPNEVLLMLSEYFTEMSVIINSMGGVLLEFIGDAIMAVFNAPLNVPSHSAACIEATLLMQEKLAELRVKWSAQGLPEVHIRCGIHTGNVFVGNLGAPDRFKFGLMGDSVNLASRLEELNKKYDTSILISGDVLSEMVQALYLLRQVDVVQVKGRSTGTALYTVCGRKQYDIPKEIDTEESIKIDVDSDSNDSSSKKDAFPDSNIIRSHRSKRDLTPVSATHLEIVKLHGEGMKLYFQRDFKQAKEKFIAIQELALTENKHDSCAALLEERCSAYILNPPPLDWDGIEVMKSKQG